MISAVLSGSSGDVNTNTSVKSKRPSSPGNLSLSALKWFDMVPPWVVIVWMAGAAAGRPLRGGSSSAVFTWSPWVRGMARWPHSMSSSCAGSRLFCGRRLSEATLRRRPPSGPGRPWTGWLPC